MPLLDHPSGMEHNPAAIEEASLPVLDVLLNRLTSVGGGGRNAAGDDYSVVTAVAEGLAKLLLHQQLPGSQSAPLEAAETHKACRDSQISLEVPFQTTHHTPHSLEIS